MSELPKGWVESNLGELTVNPKHAIISGPFGSNLKSDEYVSEGVPIIRLQNVDRNKFLDKNIRFITTSKAKELKAHSFQSDDIVISKLGDPLGKACIVPEKFSSGIVVADVVRLRLDETYVSKNYVTYAINSPSVVEQINQEIKGSTRPRVNLTHIRDLKIPLAPLPEQKRIVAKLEKLSERVERSRKKLDRVAIILKLFKQSLLAAVCSGKLTKDWREKNGCNLDEWSNHQLIGLFRIATGGTPDRKKKEYFVNGSIPWIKTQEVQNCKIYETSEKITKEAIKDSNAKIFPVDTLLIAMYGEGKTRGQIGRLMIPAATNQACAALIGENLQKETIDFVYYYLLSQYQEFRKESSGGNQPNLNLSKIKQWSIELPPSKEQQEIVRRVEQLFAIADKIEQRYTKANKQVEKLTQSILAKAFHGELVPQDPKDPPASELLVKIEEERERVRSKAITKLKTVKKSRKQSMKTDKKQR